tara:strand:- start:179 stop:325 length:147 start_codon:yes stop_codon:yes gene_type:complete
MEVVVILLLQTHLKEMLVREDHCVVWVVVELQLLVVIKMEVQEHQIQF